MLGKKTGLLILWFVASQTALAQSQDHPPPSRPEKLAQDASAPPLCTAQQEGLLSCQANRICECIHANAVPAQGLPARWRWDCSIKRPQCEQPPADLGQNPGQNLDLSDWPVIIDYEHEHGHKNKADRPR
ncbi:hypothetical protein [Iodidimonas gelatinilytica]|uniref:hypothetical protein n=1 Tax=Iodidimonas gelatinilytica TaxID=1236966 RepID=UPI0012309826|nr:hypothetical protein [Iodidimonas gelatinilytica]